MAEILTIVDLVCCRNIFRSMLLGIKSELLLILALGIIYSAVIIKQLWKRPNMDDDDEGIMAVPRIKFVLEFTVGKEF